MSQLESELQIDSGIFLTASKAIANMLDPVNYLTSLGFECYPWQRKVLKQGIKRMILNCARQSGKSTVIAAKVTHRAKYYPNSLIMIFAPTENQAVELMEKIGLFMKMDEEIVLIRDSTIEKRLNNNSRIRAFTANPKSARGYSDPDIIIFDEAAYVDDELYLTVRPMMTGGKTELLLLSTPHGKTGFFYETWERTDEKWTKVMVKVQDVLAQTHPDKYSPVDVVRWEKEQADKGVAAFISPRHYREFLLEELDHMGDLWFSQEYGCDFINVETSVFDVDSFMTAFTDSVKPLDDYQIQTVDEEALWRG